MVSSISKRSSGRKADTNFAATIRLQPPLRPAPGVQGVQHPLQQHHGRHHRVARKVTGQARMSGGHLRADAVPGAGR